MRFSRGRFFRLFVGLARAGLVVEGLWPALWPAVAVAGLFLAVALLDLFVGLGPWLHLALLAGFAGAFSFAAYRGFSAFRPADENMARHRIEEDSGLVHRPLVALDDHLATGTENPASVALWQAHRERMAESVRRLRLKAPAAGLARRDPWGLRAALVLILLIGAVAAGRDAPDRLAAAFRPAFAADLFARTVEVDVWINPPAYTARPPIYLQAGRKAAEAPARAADIGDGLAVPVGSTVVVQVTGGGRVPSLRVGEKHFPLDRVGAESYHLERALPEGNRLAVMQGGRVLADWPLSILADHAPEVAFSAAPDATRRLRFSIPFEAKDDYGVNNVTAIIRRIDGVAIPGGAREIRLRLALPGRGRKEVKGRSRHDLAAHVWAGLPVFVELQAVDGKGQTGLSATEPAVLPARHFSHPVARELVDLRRELTSAPESRKLIAWSVDNLAGAPAAFGGDTGVYLALRVIRERLLQGLGDKVVAEAQDIMWDAALRLEDGTPAISGRDLLAAQRRLLQAMRNNADAARLERLMSELQRRFNEYMRSLMRELRRLGQLQPLDPNAQLMERDDLQRLLDRARELMRQGSMDAARQLMAEFQRLMESLRGAVQRQGRMSKEARQAQKSLRELGDLVRRQQKLLDQTYRRAQEGTEDPSGKQAGEQEAIRRKLGELMRRFSEMLGKMPPNLGKAEKEMRQAGKALKNGKPGDAVGPQTRALEALRKGSRSAARQMARRFSRGGRQFGRRGFGITRGPLLRGMRPGNRDPFGRRLEEGGTGSATGSVKIPNSFQMQRAREILRELRRRAGESWRPSLELDYIERLLKLF